MGTFYYLSSCDTCKRIMNGINFPEGIALVDIKSSPLSGAQIDALQALSGSYEALINKRAQRYKAQNLKEQNLDEAGFRNLLLEHYTFLKRPVLQVSNKIFIGNSAANVAAIKAFFSE
ncbi:MAG: arsenate reductase family protein [Flavobacteriaceae bacterium]